MFDKMEPEKYKSSTNHMINSKVREVIDSLDGTTFLRFEDNLARNYCFAVP